MLNASVTLNSFSHQSAGIRSQLFVLRHLGAFYFWGGWDISSNKGCWELKSTCYKRTKKCITHSVMVWRFSFPACHQCKPRFSTLKEPVKTRETRECVLCSKLFTVDLLLYTECKALFSWVIYCSRNNFIS